MNRRFPKAEHLCSRRLIERLYAEGQRLRVFPYNVQWLEVPAQEVPCQVLIVVPKRRLHHAVDRNRVKRLTRECYRLHKEPLLKLLQDQERCIALSLVYLHNEVMTYEQLYHKFDKLMAALEKELSHEEDIPRTETTLE
ncbi:MAG: ribonuclease P protein component [Bacteroidales bacterium]|nr:ribonuclease P protein component [Bacteroidales bacterium]